MALPLTLLPSHFVADDDGARERELVGRALAKDAAAFRRLFELHAAAVHRFLKDMLGDEAAADEGTQETFVRAHDRLGSLRATDRVRPWLLGIARNVCFEARRARRRALSLSFLFGRDEEEPATDDGESPEARLLSRERVDTVTRALARLSEERRAALLLRLDHELPYEDLARTMGWSVAKAKVEVHRARGQLKAALDDAEAGDP